MPEQTALILLALVSIIAGAILGPLTLMVWYRRFQRLVQGLNETPLYRPVGEHELPTAVRRFVDKHTRQIIELGFRPLGDFQVRQTLDHYCRLFLDPSGTTGCELAYLDAWARKHRVVCLFTLFDNLDSAETGNVALQRQEGPTTLRGLPRASVKKLLAAHQETIRDLQDQRHIQAVELDAGDLPLVATYLAVRAHVRLRPENAAGPNNAAETLAELRTAVEQLIPQPVA